LMALGIVTGTRLSPSWNQQALQSALDENPAGHRRLASAELLDAETLALARAPTTPTLVDLHDEPISQSTELGHVLTAEATNAFRDLVSTNVSAFRYVVMPTPEYAAFAGVDKRQTLIASNGTDTRQI